MRMNCIVQLIKTEKSYVPRGWHTRASIIPAVPPAIGKLSVVRSYKQTTRKFMEPNLPMRLVAAEGGALPSEPFTLFADILCFEPPEVEVLQVRGLRRYSCSFVLASTGLLFVSIG